MNKSLQAKITIIVSSVIVATIIILMTYTTIVNRNNAIKDSKKELIAKTEYLALKIKNLINTAFNVLESENANLLMLDKEGKLNKDITIKIVETNLRRDKDFTGMCLIFEPNTLCKNDTSHPELTDNDKFIPYLFWGDNNSIGIDSLVAYDVPGDGDYYLIPRETKKQLLTEPYLYPVNGRMVLMITLVSPLMEGNEFQGISTIDYDVKFTELFAEKIKKETYDGQIEVSIVSNEGVYVANTADTSFIGKDIKTLFKANNEARLKSIKAGKKEVYFENDELIIKEPVKFGKTDNFWQIQVSVPRNIIYADAQKETLVYIVFGIIILIISIIIIFYTVKKYMQPIKKLATIGKKISTGNFNIDIDIYRNDEIGLLAETYRNMIENFRDMISKIKITSNSVYNASNQLSATSEQLSRNANEQASTAEEIASEMEQILGTITSNSQKAQITSKTASKSVKEMEASNDIFMQTVESVSNISQKISIISEIAFQTNILSLNASIEAARAGASGKGFAVVAHEVRNLAEKAKIASEEISEMSNSGQEISKEAGAKLSHAIPKIIQIAHLIDEIVNENVSQEHSIGSINKSIQQLTEIANENSASAEQMTASASELSLQAQELENLVSIFKINEESLFDEKKENFSITNSLQEKKQETTNSQPQINEKPGFSIDLSDKNIDNDDEFEIF